MEPRGGVWQATVHEVTVRCDLATEQQMQGTVLEEEGEGDGAHSSTLAWRAPWTEEPGGLQSVGSLGVTHD